MAERLSELLRQKVAGIWEAQHQHPFVRGIGDGRLLLQYVPRSDKLQVGDVAITSGIGGVFPAGLVVGRVAQVRQKDVDVFQEALVETTVDMRSLERTYVFLRTAPGAEPAGD